MLFLRLFLGEYVWYLWGGDNGGVGLLMDGLGREVVELPVGLGWRGRGGLMVGLFKVRIQSLNSFATISLPLLTAPW